MSRRKRNYFFNDLIKFYIFIFVILIFGFTVKYKEQVKNYGYIFLAMTLAICVIFAVFLFARNKKIKSAYFNYDEDNKILYMFKGMPPEEFEKEIAYMFTRLGYIAEHVGHSHDGGIDVIAKKDGEEYLIQCKKYLTSVVGVNDVRALNGVVSSHLAKKGFIITTNNFSPEAIREFKNNPRVELVDSFKLLEYYKDSHKNL